MITRMKVTRENQDLYFVGKIYLILNMFLSCVVSDINNKISEGKYHPSSSTSNQAYKLTFEDSIILFEKLPICCF